nr:hypothetical protein [Tanacetum cinerariifolium]
MKPSKKLRLMTGSKSCPIVHSLITADADDDQAQTAGLEVPLDSDFVIMAIPHADLTTDVVSGLSIVAILDADNVANDHIIVAACSSKVVGMVRTHAAEDLAAVRRSLKVW